MNIKYCAILNWSLTPYCNFKCVYCNAKLGNNTFLNRLKSTDLGRYITNTLWEKKHSLHQLKEWKQSMSTQDTIIKVLNVIKQQFNNPVKIRLLGGEPFIFPDFLELAYKLTKEHFIDVETNLSLNLVGKFCEQINPLRVDKIRASFHIEEFEKRHLVKRYLENTLTCMKKGFNIECFAVVYPPIIKKFYEYHEFFLSEGIYLNAQPFIGYYEGLNYPQAYTSDEIQQLKLDPLSFHNFENTKGRPCSAGKSFFVISTICPGSGIVYPCYAIHKKLGTIVNGFSVLNELIVCPFEKCYCDPKFFEKDLFYKTVTR